MKHTASESSLWVQGYGNKGHRRVLTRMHLPAARAAPMAAASTAYLSSTKTSSLVRPLALAASGIYTLADTTVSALKTAAMMLHGLQHGHEPETLASGTAIFKPRIVRFVNPVLYCQAPGLPSGEALSDAVGLRLWRRVGEQ